MHRVLIVDSQLTTSSVHEAAPCLGISKLSTESYLGDEVRLSFDETLPYDDSPDDFEFL